MDLGQDTTPHDLLKTRPSYVSVNDVLGAEKAEVPAFLDPFPKGKSSKSNPITRRLIHEAGDHDAMLMLIPSHCSSNAEFCSDILYKQNKEHSCIYSLASPIGSKAYLDSFALI